MNNTVKVGNRWRHATSLLIYTMNARSPFTIGGEALRNLKSYLATNGTSTEGLVDVEHEAGGYVLAFDSEVNAVKWQLTYGEA